MEKTIPIRMTAHLPDGQTVIVIAFDDADALATLVRVGISSIGATFECATDQTWTVTDYISTEVVRRKKYKVTSRDGWIAALQERFGDQDRVHRLSSEQIVDAITAICRAEIREQAFGEANGVREIRFHTNYD